MFKKYLIFVTVLLIVISFPLNALAANVDIDSKELNKLLKNEKVVDKAVNEFLFKDAGRFFSEKELKVMRKNKIEMDAIYSVPGLSDLLYKNKTTVDKVVNDYLNKDAKKYFSKRELEDMKKNKISMDNYFNKIVMGDYKFKSTIPQSFIDKLNSAKQWAIAKSCLAYLKLKGYDFSASFLAKGMFEKNLTKNFANQNKRKMSKFKLVTKISQAEINMISAIGVSMGLAKINLFATKIMPTPAYASLLFL